MISLSLELVKENDATKTRKTLIYMSHRFARLFDLSYAAACDDPNDIFYQDDPDNEDLNLLLENMEFSIAEDPNEHREILEKRMEEMYSGIASIMRGFKHKSFWKQAISTASWAVYYSYK